ncbi:MAG TPA: histone deacetylase [Thermoanaerobaculia bacterium]
MRVRAGGEKESGYHPPPMQIFTSPRCLHHRAPRGYPEREERLSGILEHLRGRGWPIVEDARHERAREAVEAVHDAGYVERFERAVRRGDSLIDSADNPLSPDTWDAAWGAVEATLAAADWAAEGRTAFAAVRPPGHHAERSMAMGFCFFNSIAVAAEHLRRRGASRVAIFDFDVHHGNGTQHLFEERGDVFYASTHQYPFYPGTGAANERGRGDGEGATLNVPLPAGTGDERYAEAIEGVVIPALRRFAPEALLISAGFDAWQNDPLGGMNVTEQGFRSWGDRLRELARELCEGRLLAVLEGGYDLRSLPGLVEVCLEGLADGRALTP